MNGILEITNCGIPVILFDIEGNQLKVFYGKLRCIYQSYGCREDMLQTSIWIWTDHFMTIARIYLLQMSQR